MTGGANRQHKPVIYQQNGGKRAEVPGEYVLLADNRGAFSIGNYDQRLPLVIDPQLSYSTYLGGGDTGNSYNGITVDAAGAFYVVGNTSSATFPVSGPFQPKAGGNDAYIT